MAMKFGVILPHFGPNSAHEDFLATVEAAERLGYDSIWTTDHILLPSADSARFGRIYESVTTLAYAAGQTETIKLGISCLVLPQRDPILVAKQIAALDALSNGRVILCVVVGWSPGEYENLGQPFHNRGRRMDEAMEVLRTLWSAGEDESVSFYGANYQFKDASFSPPPIQDGGPPLWVGGNSKAAMQRAARHGDAWHPTSLSLDRFQKHAKYFQTLLKDRNPIISARLSLSFDDTDSQTQLEGSPETIQETLRQYQLAGLSYPVITFPGDTHQVREQAMQRFREQVAETFIDSQ